MTGAFLTRFLTTGLLLLSLMPSSLADSKMEERYRFRGSGEFYDGRNYYRCWELRIDFEAQRARFKCDGYDITLKHAQKFERQRASFKLLTINEVNGYRPSDYEVELECDTDIRRNYNEVRLYRFSCQGRFSDRGFFNDRSISASFYSTEAAIPYTWD